MKIHFSNLSLKSYNIKKGIQIYITNSPFYLQSISIYQRNDNSYL